MHEVSLMQNLLKIVEDAAAREGGGKVKTVHLRVGEMAGVNADSLNFAFEILTEGTIVEGGRLEIEKIPLRIHCRGCLKDFSPVEFTLRCTACGGKDMEIMSGREMEVDYILLEDEKV